MADDDGQPVGEGNQGGRLPKRETPAVEEFNSRELKAAEWAMRISAIIVLVTAAYQLNDHHYTLAAALWLTSLAIGTLAICCRALATLIREAPTQQVPPSAHTGTTTHHVGQ